MAKYSGKLINEIINYWDDVEIEDLSKQCINEMIYKINEIGDDNEYLSNLKDLFVKRAEITLIYNMFTGFTKLQVGHQRYIRGNNITHIPDHDTKELKWELSMCQVCLELCPSGFYLNDVISDLRVYFCSQ